MALFVQIDHFRKTDQKPTVKNHLFSISWFRSFNRTSFQQQLKRVHTGRQHPSSRASIVHPFNNNWNETETCRRPSLVASIVHPFNNNWNISFAGAVWRCGRFNRTSFQQQLKRFSICLFIFLSSLLQSYILSTTTETVGQLGDWIHHNPLQSYILSTTTETFIAHLKNIPGHRFNRTSFQQQLKHMKAGEVAIYDDASIVHPFNNNWNISCGKGWSVHPCFNRTSFQQQLKHR